MGIFGDMFDFNHDGKLDTFEQAAEFSFLMNMMEEEEKQKRAEQEDEFDDLELDEILDD